LSRRVDEAKAATPIENKDDEAAREKLLKELEDILLVLDSLKTDIVRLRADVLKRNS
jgi:hypothetical protein